MELSERQNELTEKLAAAGFEGKWWGRGDAAQRFYFGDKTAAIKRNGRPVRGIQVWLQFDEPAILDGVSLQCRAPKRWYEVALAARHKNAVLIAIEIVDPAEAAKLRAEIEAAEAAEQMVGDLVGGEGE